MNGYALIRQLQGAHMHEAAAEVARLLEEREEREPRMKALEFELNWLLGQVRRGQRARAMEVEPSEDDDEPLVVKTWMASDETLAGPIVERPLFAVVQVTPRLQSLAEGELPSERGYREGRTP